MSTLHPSSSAAKHAGVCTDQDVLYLIAVSSLEHALQSHASQQQCGVTTAAADWLVELVQQEALLVQPGEVTKLYGASSVGHAASGKLCILA